VDKPTSSETLPNGASGWIAALSGEAVQSADLSARCAAVAVIAPLSRAPNLGPAGSASEEAMREEDFPAEQPEAEEEARIPHPHAYARRPRGDWSAAREVALPSVRLIWRVRGRSSFRALARGRRRRENGVEVTSAILGAPADPPRVAFAVNRSYGSAVARNRVRRQLREAVRSNAALLEPGRAYLVRPVGAPVPQPEMAAAVRRVLTKLAEDPR
jgi:ribonuclease P protein component